MLLAAQLLLILTTSQVGAQGVLRDSFENPSIQWGEPRGRGSFRIERHEKSRDARSGTSSEALVVTSSDDAPVFIAYRLDGARVIDELTARVWLKANRPGIQLLAQVVLPRSRDRQGNPLTMLATGSFYTQPGGWQELTLTGIPAQIERESRSLRFTFGPSVDLREAYVDRLILNVGGRGVTTLMIDDLEVTGIAELGTVASPAFRPISTAGGAPAANVERRVPHVRLSGTSLLVGDAPMLVRAITHRGEPLEFLRNLGFNAIKLKSPVTADIAEQAERLDLWIICPPPPPDEQVDRTAGSPPLLGREFDRVLAWDLGDQLAAAQLEDVKQTAESIRVRDREMSRPTLGGVIAELQRYSRHADILVFDRSPIGSSLELPRYMQWLRDRAGLVRGTAPVWATIQTEPLPELEEQLTRLSSGRVRNLTIQSEQVRLLAYSAIAGGARGLIFQSRSRLDQQSPTAQHRTRLLELLNIELSIAEPWAASSNFVHTIAGSDPETLTAVFETSQSRVLLPLWSGKGTQYVPSQLAGTKIWFDVPGVPESFNAYEVTPADLPLPRTRRVTGGTRVTVDEFSLTGVVLLTNDPVAVQRVQMRLGAVTPRAAALQRELALSRFHAVVDLDRRLSQQGQMFARSSEYLALAQQQLSECDALLAAGRHAAAYLVAERAVRPLRLIEHGHWKGLTADLPSLAAAPFLTSAQTMTEQRAFAQNIAGMRFAPTELAGGDFERMQVLEQLGWKHIYDNEPGVKTGAELSSMEPRFGRFSLRLWAQPVDAAEPPLVLEKVPVWVSSPAVNVAAGELLQISGWVRVPGPPAGSVDGLLVFDSIGGIAMAERIAQTDGWQQFTFYRVASQSGPITVHFALTGLGQAWIDEVSIQRAAIPREPPRATAQLPPGFAPPAQRPVPMATRR